MILSSACKLLFALAGLLAGCLAPLATTAQPANTLLRFDAAPSASDLVCPSPPAAPVRPAPLVETAQPPPLDAMGPLARPVVREQPPTYPSLLADLAAIGPETAHPLRIAVWGDSHVAAGAFMPTVIERLQARGLTVGPGVLPPSMGRANVRLRGLRAYCIGAGWSTELAYTAKGRLQVGPGLINRVAQAGVGSYLWLDLRAPDRQPILRRLQIIYRAPEGATLDVSVDDRPEQQAELVPGPESRTVDLETDGRIGVVKLRVGRGRILMEGFMLEPAKPPQVVFDVFGTPSSTVQGWANADPAYLAQSLHGADYDFVVLEYGTNDGGDPAFDRDRYAAGLKTALGRLRQVFPQAHCLLIGPPDRGVLWRRGETPDVLTFARTLQDIDGIQAQVGPEFGCAHWDWQALMGGAGGSYGWFLHAPPLMGPDLTHLTAAGYRLTGEALARSLGF